MLGILSRFCQDLREHQQIIQELETLLPQFLEPKFLQTKRARMSILNYLEKNIFSILFQSLYRALGIPKERRIFYGKVNHCLRGMVTAADNLLDDEDKAMLPLNLPTKARKSRAILTLLLFQKSLEKTLDEGQENGFFTEIGRQKITYRLFNKLTSIGMNEAQEEREERFLSPQEITTEVHHFKGGSLLTLAFVAPSVVEREKLKQLRLAENGIYKIGLGLQMIDDVVDFELDLKTGKQNLLNSYLHYYGTGKEEKEKFTPTPLEVRGFTSVIVSKALKESLSGFDLLEKAGFWLKRKSASFLIRKIFELRGVSNLIAQAAFSLQKERK